MLLSTPVLALCYPNLSTFEFSQFITLSVEVHVVLNFALLPITLPYVSTKLCTFSCEPH